MQKTTFPYHLIIAEDCSTDGTREVLIEYKKQYPDHIQLVLQQKNVGAIQNYHTLLPLAKTKYVLYMEGDDYFIDDLKLQKQVDFLEANMHLSGCFHPTQVIFEDSTRQSYFHPALETNITELTLEDIAQNNYIHTVSAMYRWRFINENMLDYYPPNTLLGEWHMQMLHAEKGPIGYMKNQVMAVYRRHKNGLWWNFGAKAFFQKYGLAYKNAYLFMAKYFKGKISDNVIQSYLDEAVKYGSK